MLTIKNRYPLRKAFIYGGGAFMVGFAGAMSLLVDGSVNKDQFVSVLPHSEIAQEVQNEEAAPVSNDEPQTTSSDASWTAPPSQPTYSNSGSKPASTKPSAQSTPQDAAPSETTSPPSSGESTPPSSQPDPEPNTDEPTVIEEVIDIITP